MQASGMLRTGVAVAIIAGVVTSSAPTVDGAPSPVPVPDAVNALSGRLPADTLDHTVTAALTQPRISKMVQGVLPPSDCDDGNACTQWGSLRERPLRRTRAHGVYPQGRLP